MNKFVWNDSWVGEDKDLHFVYAALIVAFVSLITGNYLLGMQVSAAVFTLKEILWDMLLGKGTPSLQDWIISMLGVLVGAFIYVFVKALIVLLTGAYFSSKI